MIVFEVFVIKMALDGRSVAHTCHGTEPLLKRWHINIYYFTIRAHMKSRIKCIASKLSNPTLDFLKLTFLSNLRMRVLSNLRMRVLGLT